MHITDVPGTCDVQMVGALLEKETQLQFLEELLHDVLESGSCETISIPITMCVKWITHGFFLNS